MTKKKNPNLNIVIDVPGEWTPDRKATIFVNRGKKTSMRCVDASTQQEITDGIWQTVQALTDFEAQNPDLPTRLESKDKYKPSANKVTRWIHDNPNDPGFVSSPYSTESRYNVPPEEDWLDYARCPYSVGERVYLPDYSAPGRVQRLFANATCAKVQLLPDGKAKKNQPAVTVNVERIRPAAEFDKRHNLSGREKSRAERDRLPTDKRSSDGTPKKQALL